jgi:ribose 5-phosphate isomerase B
MSRSFYLGSDHGALDLKNQLVSYIRSAYPDFLVEDLGTHSTESVDYPDIAGDLSLKVLESDGLGILCCGTGIGMSLKANRYKGIRAALVYDIQTAMLAKQHNNANILCMGGRTHSFDQAKSMVDAWMGADFEGDRHQRRLDKLDS